MLKRLSLLFLIVLSLVGCSSLDEAKMGYGAVDIYLEPNCKLENVDWSSSYPCYTTRSMGDSEVAVTYSYCYRTSEKSSDEVLVANFIETKLSSRELEDYYKFKANGGTIEDFLKSSGKIDLDNSSPMEDDGVKESSDSSDSVGSDSVGPVVDNLYSVGESSTENTVLDEFGYPKK